VAVLGCGPVGLFTIMSAFVLGAGRVIAVDAVPERLALAERLGAETVDESKVDAHERIVELTKGHGPDAVVDAVGMESHGADGFMQKAAGAIQASLTATERPYALNLAIKTCRPGGVVSVPGVYIGTSVPTAMGAFMNKGLTMKTGQTHVQRYMKKLMALIEQGAVDPTVIITHRTAALEDGPALYETFRDKKDGCVKVVMFPHGSRSASSSGATAATPAA
jgi:threonine dehydrogenase-like Zn-dependent dehydrogenase